MRIQHNIPAMNAYGNYNKNTKALQGNLQKLSSGYKINKAGDDAAGLAISEKMRAQITGLEVAQKNAKDGISLVQTAEGALTEVHTMLNRMYSLAEQSANGTYDEKVDREQLQKEVQSLRDEIDRIADATNFNGQKLLDGKLAGATGKGAKTVVNVGGAALTAANGAKHKISFTMGAPGAANEERECKIGYTDKDGNAHETTISYKATNGAAATNSAAPLKTELQKLFGDDYNVTESNGKITIEAAKEGETNFHIASVYEGKKGNALTHIAAAPDTETVGKNNVFAVTFGAGVDMSKDAGDSANIFKIDDKTFELVTRGKKAAEGNIAIYVDKSTGVLDADAVKQVKAQLDKYGVQSTIDTTTTTTLNIIEGNGKSSSASGGLTLQIGDTADNYNKMTVSINDCHADAIGIGDVDISKQDGASAGMTAIKNAINYVSDVRGTLGSLQNRLDHTINNLSVQQENIQDAEATIRDVDVANEMMAYTKNNILVQSAQAMLAQANQLPQGVLQLLG